MNSGVQALNSESSDYVQIELLGPSAKKKNAIALVSTSIYKDILQFKWYLSKSGYPVAYESVDKKIKFNTEKKDGDIIRKDDIIAQVQGNARSILKAERVALNFLQHLSGISTQAFKFNKLASTYKAKVLDTRKTTPGWRTLEKYAVKTGNGVNHRFGLYDMVLIKDNHIAVAGSIKKAIVAAKKKRKRGVKIEVEIKTLDQVKEAIKEKPDIVMLDNLSLDEMEIAIDWIRKHDKKIKIEASGNVTLESVEEIAKTGVDFISVGSALTLSSPALDISLDIEIE